MQLVMRRYRLTGTYWNKFKINAQIALEDDEGSLIDKYLLKEAILVTGNRWRDMKRAFWISGSISAIIALVYSTTRLSIMIPLSIFLSILLLLCIFGLLSFIIYQQIREEVRVIDLIVGRDFRARSLLDLLGNCPPTPVGEAVAEAMGRAGEKA